MCYIKFCILIGILDELFDFVPPFFYKSTLFDLILPCTLGFKVFSFKKLNNFFFYWALVQGLKEAW